MKKPPLPAELQNALDEYIRSLLTEKGCDEALSKARAEAQDATNYRKECEKVVHSALPMPEHNGSNMFTYCGYLFTYRKSGEGIYVDVTSIDEF